MLASTILFYYILNEISDVIEEKNNILLFTIVEIDEIKILIIIISNGAFEEKKSISYNNCYDIWVITVRYKSCFACGYN